jgi:peptide/nickel transport system substrate-binding protein
MRYTIPSKGRVHWLKVLAASLSAALLGLSSSSLANAADAKTLTIAVNISPVSLDPALQNVDPVNGWFIQLPYAALIKLSNTGKLVPDLATSWKFVDSDSTKFQLTLRDAVKFNDGTPVTAEDVVKSLQYMIAKGVNGPNWLGKETTVKKVDDHTVEIDTASPNSTLPYLLTQRTYLGAVISEKGLSNPTALKSASYGAGPYMLDTSATIPNDKYVFVPNENYWDKSKIQWGKIVVKVAGSISASMQAVQNGEADMMRGDYITATTAKAAGLNVQWAPGGLYGVGFLDRAGKLAPALANVKVRQALSYAIDRKAITKAIWGDFATAGNDLTLKGFLGYSDEVSNSYPYDPEKAKQLLKEAGYPNGFTFNMQTTNQSGADVPAQAMVQYWSKIGVTAKLTTYSDTTQLINDTLAGKYAAGVYFYGQQQPYLQAKSFFNGGANQYNPFNSTDATVNDLLKQAAAASKEDDQQTLYEKVMKRAMVDEAWFVNLAYTPQVTIYRKGLTGMQFDSQLASPDVAWSVAPAK